jgi:hypothetical protein
MQTFFMTAAARGKCPFAGGSSLPLFHLIAQRLSVTALISHALVAACFHLCRYTGIHIGPPCLEEEYRQEEITPQQCRLRDITYAGERSVTPQQLE